MDNIELATNPDARVWAKEFVRINGGDEGLMIAWFANAIMCGYDHARGNPPLCGDHLQHIIDNQQDLDPVSKEILEKNKDNLYF